MIDLHCHLLPGIDDGAKTLDESLLMARIAVDNGIHFSVMTPHINPGRYDNTRSIIQSQLNEFRQALRFENIPLHVGMAAEVRLAPEILALIDDDEVPFLGELDGYQILLLEFPHTHIPPGADKLIAKLLTNGVRPMIAHPERNKDIIRDIDKIEPFFGEGCLLQVTAASLTGLFGEGASLRARQLLEFEMVTILASDAHNLAKRPPILHEGLDVAARILGTEAANDLVYKNPLSILRSSTKSAKVLELPIGARSGDRPIERVGTDQRR